MIGGDPRRAAEPARSTPTRRRWSSRALAATAAALAAGCPRPALPPAMPPAGPAPADAAPAPVPEPAEAPSAPRRLDPEAMGGLRYVVAEVPRGAWGFDFALVDVDGDGRADLTVPAKGGTVTRDERTGALWTWSAKSIAAAEPGALLAPDERSVWPVGQPHEVAAALGHGLVAVRQWGDLAVLDSAGEARAHLDDIRRLWSCGDLDGDGASDWAAVGDGRLELLDARFQRLGSIVVEGAAHRGWDPTVLELPDQDGDQRPELLVADEHFAAGDGAEIGGAWVVGSADLRAGEVRLPDGARTRLRAPGVGLGMVAQAAAGRVVLGWYASEEGPLAVAVLDPKLPPGQLDLERRVTFSGVGTVATWGHDLDGDGVPEAAIAGGWLGDDAPLSGPPGALAPLGGALGSEGQGVQLAYEELVAEDLDGDGALDLVLVQARDDDGDPDRHDPTWRVIVLLAP